MDSVLGFILGGGRGHGLHPLTRYRSTPAVTVAGKYRLIDIPVSNCINSGIRRLYVLTQFLSVSLHRHIANTYKFAPFSGGFVEVLAAQQTNETSDWYRGTADALRQNLRYIQTDSARDVLILSSDGLYRMNYGEMLRTHRDSNADVTFGVVPVRRSEASGLGILKLDENNRLLELVEKPKTPEQLDAVRASPSWLEQRGLADSGKEYLANMGVYLCRRETLLKLLQDQPEAVDLVTQHFARIVRSHHLQGHLFDGYFQDLGSSIRAYFEANLALAGDHPPFNFHSPEGVIYTHMRNLPAARVLASKMEHGLVSEGCVIGEGVQIERACIGQRLRIGRDVVLRDVVLCGADRIETEEEKRLNRELGQPNIGIGDGSVITRAILDKDCRIGRQVRIQGDPQRQDTETAHYVIRDGIVVISRGAIIPDGTVI